MISFKDAEFLKEYPRPSHLPADPDKQNEDRAEWAQIALEAFQKRTKTDAEDALSDLLADLRHWADRRSMNFEKELDRAMSHYFVEIGCGPVIYNELDEMCLEIARELRNMSGFNRRHFLIDIEHMCSARAQYLLDSDPFLSGSFKNLALKAHKAGEELRTRLQKLADKSKK